MIFRQKKKRQKKRSLFSHPRTQGAFPSDKEALGTMSPGNDDAYFQGNTVYYFCLVIDFL